MSQASHKIIDRIKKLLALGTNNPNEHEAEIAMRRAHRLLAEYNLTMADMTESEKASADPYTRDDQVFRERFRPYGRLIATAVAELYFCKMFSLRTERHDIYTFVGRQTNVAIARMVSESVCATLCTEAKRLSSHPGFQTNFMKAASARVALRCVEMVQQAERGEAKTESGDNLPALRTTYAAEYAAADKFAAEHFGEIKEKPIAGSGGRGGQEGALYGHAAGGRVSLRPGVTGSSRKALR